jgi:hypothetical protein
VGVLVVAIIALHLHQVLMADQADQVVAQVEMVLLVVAIHPQ